LLLLLLLLLLATFCHSISYLSCSLCFQA